MNSASSTTLNICLLFLGVQKERMVAADMYVFSADGKVLSEPAAKPWPNKPPKCTDCAPLFMKVCEFSLFLIFAVASTCFYSKTSSFLLCFEGVSDERSWGRHSQPWN